MIIKSNCHARNLICFIAVKSMGYKFNEIADTLKIYPVRCVAYLTGGASCNSGKVCGKRQETG
jgi:hypothetical protein